MKFSPKAQYITFIYTLIITLQLLIGISIANGESTETMVEKFITAAGVGNLDDLETLLSQGVDINATIEPGLTALHKAKMSRRKDTVEFLVEKGADPNIPIPPNDKLADAIINQIIKGNSPGVAVLVSQNGEILYQKGFGYASLEHHVPVTVDTKFRIGSITKQFTSSAILKLQEEGKLSVNDKLSKYIPDYPRGDEVTIYHLLTHTSGIHNFTNKPDFLNYVTVGIKLEDLVNSFKNDEFDFNPGEKWSYSNSGYVLLSYIIEKVTGGFYGDYLKDKFFTPLSMNDTGVYQYGPILEHEAFGYTYVDGKLQKARNWEGSRVAGAGSIYSTVGGLCRWNEAIFNGKVLSEESLKLAFTPVKLNGESQTTSGYGCGWVIGEYCGLNVINHEGGHDGFNSFLLRFPDFNATIIVSQNCYPPAPGMSARQIANKIAEIFFWDKMSPQESFTADKSVNTKVYNDYEGRYDFKQRGVMSITKEGDKLFSQLYVDPKFEIFPKSETEFFCKDSDAQIQFIRNEIGEVTHILYYQRGTETNAPKLKNEIPVEVDPAVVEAYTGDYVINSDFGIQITKEDDHLFAKITGEPIIEMFPKSETEFFFNVVNAHITFVKDDKNNVANAILTVGDYKVEMPKTK